MSKNVPKSFQTSVEIVLRYFSGKKFVQCTLEGRNLEKGQKNGKTFIFLQKAQIRSQKGSKTFWTCFEVVFLVKKLTSAPWRVETWKNSKENRQKFEISNVSKNGPKSVQTNFKFVLSYFSRKNLPCAPWKVQTGKNFKKLENFQFSKCPNTFPKVFKLVFNMLRGIFSGKKIRPVHPGGSRNRKISKNGKKFKFSKSRKTFPKVSKFLLRWFFPNFSWPVQPGDQNL